MVMVHFDTVNQLCLLVNLHPKNLSKSLLKSIKAFGSCCGKTVPLEVSTKKSKVGTLN